MNLLKYNHISYLTLILLIRLISILLLISNNFYLQKFYNFICTKLLYSSFPKLWITLSKRLWNISGITKSCGYIHLELEKLNQAMKTVVSEHLLPAPVITDADKFITDDVAPSPVYIPFQRNNIIPAISSWLPIHFILINHENIFPSIPLLFHNHIIYYGDCKPINKCILYP